MYKSQTSALIVKIYLLTACGFLLCGSIESVFLSIPLIHGTLLFFLVLIPGFLNAFSIYITLQYFPSTVCSWRNLLSLFLFLVGAICWLSSLFLKIDFLLLWKSSVCVILLSTWVLCWHFLVYLYRYRSLRKIHSFVVYSFVSVHGFLLLIIPCCFLMLYVFHMDIENMFWSIIHPVSYSFMILIIGIIADRIFEVKNRFVYRIHYTFIVLLLLLALGFYIYYAIQHQNPFESEAYIRLTMTSAIPIFFLLLYWIISLWKNNIAMSIATCFALMCMSLFIFGGLMDIFFVKYHLPIRLGDTYFTVAHFHLIIGVSIAMAWLSCIYHYWHKIFSKFNNQLFDTIFYKFHFWITFIGIYIIFTLMYYVGLIGIPKLYFASGNTNTHSTVFIYPYLMMSTSILVWIMQVVFIIYLLLQTAKKYLKKEIY